MPSLILGYRRRHKTGRSPVTTITQQNGASNMQISTKSVISLAEEAGLPQSLITRHTDHTAKRRG